MNQAHHEGRVGIDYHLPGWVVFAGRHRHVNGEVLDEVDHRGHVCRIYPVLRLLHTKDTLSSWVFEEHTEGEKAQGPFGERARWDIYSPGLLELERQQLPGVICVNAQSTDINSGESCQPARDPAVYVVSGSPDSTAVR
jgi:hypothetical protein